MKREEFEKLLPLKVPHAVAHCPICGDCIFVEGVDDWYEENGEMRFDVEIGSVSFDCTRAPDFDETEEWQEWLSGHWSMPYVDWLPVQSKVAQWLDDELRKPDALKLLGA